MYRKDMTPNKYSYHPALGFICTVAENSDWENISEYLNETSTESLPFWEEPKWLVIKSTLGSTQVKITT